ncbi:hypothetical protein [Absidia glauca]|uniref:Uncharacterized protein n=1 Tax=Absidia glauca TaxID=4829 RepID=A0A168L8C0_ABSGL|nr:hypothetical protein [Absidia glauca]
MAQRYQVAVRSNGVNRFCCVHTSLSSVEVSKFGAIKSKLIFDTMPCYSMDGCNLSPLSPSRHQLLNAIHPMKKSIVDASGRITGKFYKMQVAPIMLFTDETSGNISKQYNLYATWSMVCGALPIEERNKRSNTLFIGAVASKSGLSAINMIPRLVSDLKLLEQGAVMYSACYVILY